jgi:hypothetical protein
MLSISDFLERAERVVVGDLLEPLRPPMRDSARLQRAIWRKTDVGVAKNVTVPMTIRESHPHNQRVNWIERCRIS